WRTVYAKAPRLKPLTTCACFKVDVLVSGELKVLGCRCCERLRIVWDPTLCQPKRLQVSDSLRSYPRSSSRRGTTFRGWGSRTSGLQLTQSRGGHPKLRRHFGQSLMVRHTACSSRQ